MSLLTFNYNSIGKHCSYDKDQKTKYIFIFIKVSLINADSLI